MNFSPAFNVRFAIPARKTPIPTSNSAVWDRVSEKLAQFCGVKWQKMAAHAQNPNL
jgi:ribonuclease HI